jgi:hypothetical protein
LALDDAVQVQYISQLPLKWMNILVFTGLPVGDYMLLTGFQIDSGELWNGLVDPLGTPAITPLRGAAGRGGFWAVEQNSPIGPIRIVSYASPLTVTAAEIPEPAPVWMLGAAPFALALFQKRRHLLG